jgi:hypothetical protein
MGRDDDGEALLAGRRSRATAFDGVGAYQRKLYLSHSEKLGSRETGGRKRSSRSGQVLFARNIGWCSGCLGGVATASLPFICSLLR